MFLFEIIITPIQQILEFFYRFFREIISNDGICLIGLSIVVSLFCLPLYIVSEKWQENERLIQKKMEPQIKRIKNAFHGDEQYMMLSTFYKQNHYHPLMALRSSFSLLIQIPFFIAAYSLLTHLPDLQGKSFLFIKNLGNPDSCFSIGNISINILPILMTLINCISGAIYSKGHSLKEKIQIYGCALVFLILLYNSPSGLVIYWTMNNIFSLIKNIFFKVKNPGKILYTLAILFAILLSILSIFVLKNIPIELRLIIILFSAFLITIPLIIRATKFLYKSFFTDIKKNERKRFFIFILSSITLTVLSGIVIPSMLMSSEPEEFCYVDSYNSPFVFLISPLLRSIGLFLFWPICIYFLFSKRIKVSMTFIFVILALYGVINNFVFQGNYGSLTKTLEFKSTSDFYISIKACVINIFIFIALIVLTIFTLSYHGKFIIPTSSVILVGLIGVGANNSFTVNMHYKGFEPVKSADRIDPIFHLSKNGKNVLVIMMDRCFLPYVRPVFEEKPELAEHFDGFTFYENCMSFAPMTMMGSPGLFGGYDYTPYEINKRIDKNLQQKHNEALLSMPVTFLNNDYDVTVADMPYENYLEQPMTAMYNDYPQINRVSGVGPYSNLWYARHKEFKRTNIISETMKRNIFIFSIFKMSPPFIRRFIHHGSWWNIETEERKFPIFIDSYSEMEFLPELFDTSAQKNSFIQMVNLTTHEPVFLNAPNYEPSNEISDYGASTYSHEPLYHVMVTALKKLADFFDALKSKGVYDNTRIIVVSDHGENLDTGKFDNSNPEIPFCKEEVTATLLFKDFNERSSDSTLKSKMIKTSMEFMTNADTPYLATKDIIPKAKNPFTGNDFMVCNKNDYMRCCYPPAQSTRTRKQTKFNIDVWYKIHDNIYDSNNWTKEVSSK